MQNLILWALISWNGLSPAADMGMRWASWLSNPAFLGMRPMTQLGVSVDIHENDTILTAGYRSGNIGFAYLKNGGLSGYIIGFGMPLSSSGFWRKVAVGYSYSKWIQSAGVAFWPSAHLSLGWNVSWNNRHVFNRLGFGVRPLSKLLTIWGGIEVKDSSVLGLNYGISVTPSDWLEINATTVCPERGGIDVSGCRYSAGLIVSFGHVQVGANSVDGGWGYDVGLSVEKHGSPTTSHVVAKLVLDGEYSEYPSSNFLSGRGRSFYALISSLKKLKGHKEIKGLLIVIKKPSLSMSQFEELGRQIDEIRRSGKKIAVFSQNYNMLYLWLASHADISAIAKMGYVDMPGLMSGGIYFKKLLDDAGIDVDALHIKEYKSAVEPFTRKDMSEADRQQRMDFLVDVKNTIWPSIASHMGISMDSLEALINSQGMWNDSEAVEIGFVDTVFHMSDIKKWAEDYFDCKRISDVFSLTKPARADNSWKIVTDKIAVLYIDGGIVSGESGSDLLMGKTVGDETIVKAVKRIKEDESVKAVVVRVNSPGGSALASEEMWFVLNELKEKKPLIVSMGNVAASGGYYVSAPADIIFADSTTLTGSIGILSLKFTYRKLLEKIGINVDYIKIGEHADAMSSITRPLTAEEESIGMRELRYGYELFINRVAQSRGMTAEQVDSIGRGRIYSGLRALRIGIVDSIGGLDDAIEYARKKIHNPDAEVVFYPRAKPYKFLRDIGIMGSSGIEGTISLLKEPYIYMMPPVWFVR